MAGDQLAGEPPAARARQAVELTAAESWRLPMQEGIRDLFDTVIREGRKGEGLTPDSFVNTTLDLITEYTDKFNNDEIRAVCDAVSRAVDAA